MTSPGASCYGVCAGSFRNDIPVGKQISIAISILKGNSDFWTIADVFGAGKALLIGSHTGSQLPYRTPDRVEIHLETALNLVFFPYFNQS